MDHSQKSYLKVVDDAFSGEILLPAFQRDWSWQGPAVCSLYDSLRKNFPIGSYLFIEGEVVEQLGPKPFFGSEFSDDQDSEINNPTQLVLDGQQRITAGIALFKKAISGRYFIDLDVIYVEFQNKGIRYGDEGFDQQEVESFVQELDEEDGYIFRSVLRSNDAQLLTDRCWISSLKLNNRVIAKNFIKENLPKYSEDSNFQNFIDDVFLEHFIISKEYKIPVVTLDNRDSLAAVTKVFTAINMTGKKLTAVEIVVAVLFAGNVTLRTIFDEYLATSIYLKNVDPNSELLLQTICMLDGKTTKKALLPRNIKPDNFNRFHETGNDLIDKACGFLSSQLGFGLSCTSRLVPYPPILVTLAIVWQFIEAKRKKDDRETHLFLKKWIINSSLSGRYTEGSQSKQMKDANDIKDYLKNLYDREDVQEPECTAFDGMKFELLSCKPASAAGKMIRCIFNHIKPKDPLTTNPCYYDENVALPEEHHIWPKKFLKEIPGGLDVDPNNVLNLTLVSAQTNNGFTSHDPKQHLDMINNHNHAPGLKEDIFKDHFLSEKCIEIINKESKNADDYNSFIRARYEAIANYLNQYFNVKRADS